MAQLKMIMRMIEAGYISLQIWNSVANHPTI